MMQQTLGGSVEPGNLAEPFDHVGIDVPSLLTSERLFAARDDIAHVDGRGRTVCIVGAGMAGLVAAYELQRRGYACTVLEELGRCGGRISTFRFPDGSRGELGAQRFPLVHSATMDYVRQFDISTRTFVNSNPAGRLYFGHSSPGHSESIASVDSASHFDRLHRMFPGLDRISVDSTASSAYATMLSLLVMPVLRMIESTAGHSALLTPDCKVPALRKLRTTKLREFAVGPEIGMSSDDWTYLARATGIACFDECSVAQFVLDMVPTMSSSMVELEAGADQLPQALARRLGAADLLYGALVHSVDCRAQRPAVTWLHEGLRQSRSFDFVIMAVPPTSLSKITFKARSFEEAKIAKLAAISVAPLCKTLMHSKDRFWELIDNPIAGGLSSTDLPIQQCWYPSDNSRLTRDGSNKATYAVKNLDVSVLSGVFTASYRWGTNATNCKALSDDARSEQTIQNIADLHGLEHRDVRRGLIDLVHTHWECGYTLLPANEMIAEYRALFVPVATGDGVPRVHFAGEHLSDVHGWIVSAVLSALSVVRKITVASTDERIDE